jgi:predicted anti-sigma-YlaC factor YlaD
MTCEECAELLGDAVEGALSPSRDADVRGHCEYCGDCRALLSDMIEIRKTAATLERRIPPPSVWEAIAARIQERGTSRRGWVQIAAAAALVLATASGSWFYFTVQRGQTEMASELALSAESELQLAEQHYQNAIMALEKLTADKQHTLDPQVAEAIRQSLSIIDTAIDDSRAALRAEPGSLVAQTSLLEALRMKVVLLQETVSLINARS